MILKLIKLQNQTIALDSQEGMQQVSTNQIRLLLRRPEFNRKVKPPEQWTLERCCMLRHIWSRV
jgi:hypothetical protein